MGETESLHQKAVKDVIELLVSEGKNASDNHYQNHFKFGGRIPDVFIISKKNEFSEIHEVETLSVKQFDTPLRKVLWICLYGNHDWNEIRILPSPKNLRYYQ